jgi:hypothetical protein
MDEHGEHGEHSAVSVVSSPVVSDPVVSDPGDLLERVRGARRRSVRWLADRVADDGRPEGADIANAWWRAPWALCVAGAPDVAAAMLGWIEREALGDDGDFRLASQSLPAPQNAVYFLSPIAIAAWLLGHYGTAETVNRRLRYFQNEDTGGVYEYQDFAGDRLEDNLKTGQVGVSALVTGDRASADGVFRWLSDNYREQPELPTRLYTGRRHGQVVTEFPAAQAFVRVVDFTSTRQTYFNPGIAAAFLAGYFELTGRDEARRLGRSYLALNTQGTESQFTDPTSVQICKFGWGAAAGTVPGSSGWRPGSAIGSARTGRGRPRAFPPPRPPCWTSTGSRPST